MQLAKASSWHRLTFAHVCHPRPSTSRPYNPLLHLFFICASPFITLIFLLPLNRHRRRCSPSQTRTWEARAVDQADHSNTTHSNSLNNPSSNSLASSIRILPAMELQLLCSRIIRAIRCSPSKRAINHSSSYSLNLRAFLVSNSHRNSTACNLLSSSSHSRLELSHRCPRFPRNSNSPLSSNKPLQLQ